MVEMLTGVTPFTDYDSDMGTYKNIINGEQQLTSEEEAKLLPAARDLSNKLLTVRVAYRIGYLKRGGADVVEHLWFADFDWDGLLNATINPAWKPKFKDAEDTRFFEADDAEFSIDLAENEEDRPNREGNLADQMKWSKVQEVYMCKRRKDEYDSSSPSTESSPFMSRHSPSSPFK